MPDPGGLLEDLASGLRARAASLRAAGSAPRAALASSGWQGARADALHQRLLDPERAIHDLAGECERLAHSADVMSGAYVASIRRLAGYEAEVRHWLGVATESQLKNFPYAGRLPPSGSPQWSAVVQAARGLGG